jgi:hypothetical protein
LRTAPDVWAHRDLMPGGSAATTTNCAAAWGWSFAQAIGCLWYYVETNPGMSRTAHHTLTALLTAA